MKRISELGLEAIQLEDQVLLVDQSREYQTNGWAFNTGKGVFWVDMSDRYPSGYKFIASTKPLEGLPLLVIEEEVDKITKNEVPDRIYKSGVNYAADEQLGFKKGYNKAKETYKFTEEDLREAICEAWNSCEDNEDEETFTQVFNRIIQSLTKKELWIEVEEKEYPVSSVSFDSVKFSKFDQPKMTKNQIKAVWI